MSLWVTWQTTAAAVLIGAQIPESWSLDFAIPVVFLGLLAVAVQTRPKAVAALVGGAAAVLARDVPYQLWMIIGALADVPAGVAAERLLR